MGASTTLFFSPSFLPTNSGIFGLLKRALVGMMTLVGNELVLSFTEQRPPILSGGREPVCSMCGRTWSARCNAVCLPLYTQWADESYRKDSSATCCHIVQGKFSNSTNYDMVKQRERKKNVHWELGPPCRHATSTTALVRDQIITMHDEGFLCPLIYSLLLLKNRALSLPRPLASSSQQ